MTDYYVYIMANPWRTIYTGVTNDLSRRVYEHRSGEIPGFSARYGISSLVYYETTTSIESAIMREKQIKAWTRKKRISLIESMNPEWKDLSLDW